MSEYKLYRRENNKIEKSTELKDIFSGWKKSQEKWLFIAPHDDDICLGSGLLIQKALEEKIPLAVLITTDGSMGYGSTVASDKIVEARREETLNSFKMLGVENVSWLNFPDGNLASYQGIRKAVEEDPCLIEGHTGLQNAYTYYLRNFAPTRVFVPGGTDYHPDHKIVYQELMISIFHAGGDIWPQLGKPLDEVPEVVEMAVYCPFDKTPNIKIEVSEKIFQKKIESIRAYKSQKQIESLIKQVERGARVEYFHAVLFDLYDTAEYHDFFNEEN
jgi:LmbE family N-acetylglucosaminyl deacetylase